MTHLTLSFWFVLLLQAVGQSTLNLPVDNLATGTSLLPDALTPAVSVSISPTNATVRLGESVSFLGKVLNSTNRALIWTVNNIAGGNTNIGTITNGIYWAPLVPVASNFVQIGATSVANAGAVAIAQVTLQNPFPSIASVTPASIAFGTRTVTINGTGFVPDTVILGDDTNILTTTYVSPTQMTITGIFPPTMTRFTRFQAVNPNPYLTQSTNYCVPTVSTGSKMSFLAACRVLEQATWGPDATNVDHLQQVGFGNWLTEQKFAPTSTYQGPGDPKIPVSYIQAQFISNALMSNDQLRQRVAFALSSFIVVSGIKVSPADWYAPYMNVLSKDAFGTYANLLTDIALCPSMANYLDLANNDKANPTFGTAPNENFARELMQLFTVGTKLLNLDGTPKLDTNGLPIPTYSPELIPEMARVFTGWTYPGVTDPKSGHAILNFSAPMQAVEANHDNLPKTVLGGIQLPGGQTARQDLDATIAALVSHPNTAPFVATRLIQRLVNGNPSPAYVSRVATVFTQSGGNLLYVVWAILVDSEARRGDVATSQPPSWSGHLREPVLFTLAILRATGMPPVDGIYLDRWTLGMGQDMEMPPSVFGFYSPDDTTDTGLRAPEFRLLSEPAALRRLDFVNTLVYNWSTNIAPFNVHPFQNADASPDTLLAALNNNFYYGRMPSDIAPVIRTAIAAAPNQNIRIRNAVYLSLTANAYQVQY